MKYLFVTLLLLCSSCLFRSQTAQESWTFKHEFTPTSKYRTNTQMDMDVDMLMELPEDASVQLEQEGPDSMKMSMTMFFGVIMETSEKGEDSLPFSITYDSIQMSSVLNGEAVELPSDSPENIFNDMIIKGRILDGKMALDSMSGMAIPPGMATSMQTNMQGIQMMIDFPERPLMIGDTFSQLNQQQVSAGVAGGMGVEVRLTLKLESVEGNIATFSTTEVYNFNGGGPEGIGAQIDLSGEGYGAGTMIFDRGENQIISYTNDSDMNMLMDMGAPGGMDIKMNMISKNHIVVNNKRVE